MEFPSLYRIATVAALLLLAHLFWNRVAQYLRLRTIPGPPIAAITNVWLISKHWRNEPWRDISRKLHNKYGPVVRYGPNRVAFSDAAAIPVILGTSNVFEKAENYEVLKAIVRGQPIPSFIGAKPESRATALKKHIAHAFAPGPVLQYESHINETLAILTKQLKEYSPVVDLVEWLRYFAFDSLSRIAFSEDLGFMKNKEDIEGTLAAAQARFDHWHYWGPMPSLERFLFKNPLVLSLAKPSSRLAAIAVQKIGARRAMKGSEVEQNTSDLLDKYLEAGIKDPKTVDSLTVVGLTVSTIHAGADTTASALGVCLYHLLSNPSKLAALEAELTGTTLSNPPNFSETSQLPYLDACIRESMRLESIGGGGLERVVPDGGADIAGTWIPGGTVVTLSHHVIHHEIGIWGEDPAVFNPDRWIGADEIRRRNMQRASLSFSAGKRVCLGQHIAWLEMKKLIPHLFMTFKIQLERPNEELTLGTGAIANPKELLVRIQERE